MSFQMICYLVLMDDYMSKHPDYIEEKAAMFERSEESAYAMLDLNNQRKVTAYYEYWKLPLPSVVEVYNNRRETTS